MFLAQHGAIGPTGDDFIKVSILDDCLLFLLLIEVDDLTPPHHYHTYLLACIITSHVLLTHSLTVCIHCVDIAT